jgi:hypothetical protein
MPRRARRGQDENTNWRLRDNVTHVTDQARAAPGALRELLSVPGSIGKGIRQMIGDMRGVAEGDPRLQPIAGVDLDAYAQVEAALMAREVRASDHPGRAAVAAEHGLAEATWSAASSGWQARIQGDAALAQTYAAAVRRHATGG